MKGLDDVNLPMILEDFQAREISADQALELLQQKARYALTLMRWGVVTASEVLDDFLGNCRRLG